MPPLDPDADLEDLVRRERRARSLLQWVARAAAESSSVEAALQAAVDEVCLRMEWPLGHVMLRRADGTLTSAQIWHQDDLARFADFRRVTAAMSFASGVGLPGRVLATGRPLWIMDVTEDPNFPRQQHVGDLGVRAALAFPVLLGDEVLAVLEFFSPHAVEPDAPLVEVMAAIGTQLARVIERTRAEEALKQSELRFRSVAETANDAIVTADAAGRVVTWNRAAEALFGHREAEALGRPLTIIIPERLRAHHERGMERVRAGGARHVIGRTVELDGLRKDGSEFPIELSLATWELHGERFFTGILRDITERRQQAEKLARSQQAAVEANRAKSLFLANMSHELRTPLNAILGFVQLMARDRRLIDEQREHLGIIMRSGEHLLELINNVLSISKIEAGQSHAQPLDFSLERLLTGVREMFHARAAQRGLTLSFDTDGVPPSVHGDNGKLRQVLINLVNNAVKFTETGGIAVRVRWRDGRALFEVEDTGPGIAPDDLERVLQPFVQAKTGAEVGEGAGLGLAISRDFVRLLGGELAVRSVVGAGTAFAFELALPRSADVMSEHAGARRVVGLEPGQAALRVLVVDNAEDNRCLLARLLASVGFIVEEAADGRQAVERWQRFAPHLVWMDMRMPVLDGYEATRQIRRAEAERQQPRAIIIALTASAFDHDHPEILAAGCDDVVLKPFREATIFDAITHWLGVRFVYEGEAASAASAVPVLSAARLAALAAEDRAQLVRALGAGDDLAAQGIAARLAGQDPALSVELSTMIRNFQFDELLGLLERVA